MNLYSVINQVPPIYFSLILAAVICFLGYPMHKLGILLAGAVMGYTLGQDFALQFFDQNTADIVAICVALIGAGACLFFYTAGCFIFCGGAAAMFLSAVVGYFPVPSWVQAALMLVAFLGAGALSLKVLRTAVILITGLLGGINLLSCLLVMGFPIPAGLWQFFTMLALAGAGIIVQFTITK